MTLHEYARKAVAAGDYVRDWLMAARDGQTVFERRQHLRRKEESRIEAATADHALSLDTQEADVQLANQRAPFVRRLDELRRIPDAARSRLQELELHHLTRIITRIDAKQFGAGAIAPETRLADFGEVARPRGFLGSLAGGVPLGWVAGGVAVSIGLLGLQSARIASLKGDLTERTTERDAALQYGNEMAALAQTREQDVASVREENTQSREVIESVQARNARLEARERERNRLAQENRDAAAVDFSERLRDLTVQPFLSAPAPSGDPASGVSDAPGADPAS